MYLKSENILVELDSVTFRSYKRSTPQSWELILDESAISGWYDGVSVRRDDSIRPNQWGNFSDTARKGSRVVTLTGTAIATSINNLQTARDKFTGILQSGSYKDLKITTDTENRRISVGLEGTPSWVRMSDTVAVWKIDLFAPDPRIYGPLKTAQVGDGTIAGGMKFPLDYPLSYGGKAKTEHIYISNEGNTDAWPVFRVYGDFPTGFHLRDSRGSVVSYLAMVTHQSPVTIDMAAGTAIQNGRDRSTGLRNREWFSIPPATTIRPTFEPIQDGPGWCDIMYRDTWI